MKRMFGFFVLNVCRPSVFLLFHAVVTCCLLQVASVLSVADSDTWMLTLFNRIISVWDLEWSGKCVLGL